MVLNKRPILTSLFSTMVGLTSLLGVAQGEMLPPPSGWQSAADSENRILTKGAARLEIGPWRSLDGVDLQSWLKAQADVLPKRATLESADPIIPEPKSGGYSLTRRVTLDGVAGVSILFACPGVADAARLMHLSASSVDMANIMAAAAYAEAACIGEPKGEPGVRTAVTAPASERPVAAVAADAANVGSGVEGVYLSISAPVYTGVGWTQSEKFFVLYDDGEFVEGLDGPPAELKTSTPAMKRGRWSRSGGEVRLVWGDGDVDTRKDGGMAFNPCKQPSQTLGGHYQDTVSPGVIEYLAFRPNGAFKANFKPGRPAMLTAAVNCVAFSKSSTIRWN